MSNTITNVTQAPAAVQLAAKPSAAAPRPAQTALQPVPTDTVQISAAAKTLQEAIETPAQTAKEAAGGDAQARRLLAKEAADRTNTA